MKKTTATVAVLLMGTAAAQAGGVDRSGQSVGIIFEEGDRVELSFGHVSPSVSGTEVAPVLGGESSGDMTEDFLQVGLAYKGDISPSLSFAVIIDEPFGAKVDYPDGTGYFAAGADATLTTRALTGIFKYTTPENYSFFGGLRYQTLEAQASVPFVAEYTGDTDRASGLGYVLGAAYEIPDIALRVALTYNSAIDHDLGTEESSLLAPTLPPSTTKVSTPQSVNLEFQSGVAEDTLVFGSVRWVDWSEFDISPQHYAALTRGASLVSYEDDTITYGLGIGRRFTENWSGAVTVGYEAPTGGFSSNLGPTDGSTSLGLGATYAVGNVEVTGGLRYVWIGDAETIGVDAVGAPVAPGTSFEDNTAVGVGLNVAYKF